MESEIYAGIYGQHTYLSDRTRIDNRELNISEKSKRQSKFGMKLNQLKIITRRQILIRWLADVAAPLTLILLSLCSPKNLATESRILETTVFFFVFAPLIALSIVYLFRLLECAKKLEEPLKYNSKDIDAIEDELNMGQT